MVLTVMEVPMIFIISHFEFY